jgi:hypothetical protein
MIHVQDTIAYLTDFVWRHEGKCHDLVHDSPQSTRLAIGVAGMPSPLVHRPGEPDLTNMLAHFGYIRYKMLQIWTLIWIW